MKRLKKSPKIKKENRCIKRKEENKHEKDSDGSDGSHPGNGIRTGHRGREGEGA
jgi:hypothetical protein